MKPDANRNDGMILRRALRPQQEAVRAARSKVSMTVARLIAADVADRKLEPGSPLPPEQEMATYFGVGRPSVREALRILEAQGLVTIKPGAGGGPIVRRPTPADHGQSISLFLQMGSITYRDALEMHERLAGLIAEQAADRVASGRRELLPALTEASRNELDDDRDDASFISSGSDFHSVLSRMADNETLALLAGALDYVFAVRTAHLHEGHWTTDERKQIAAEHQRAGIRHRLRLSISRQAARRGTRCGPDQPVAGVPPRPARRRRRLALTTPNVSASSVTVKLCVCFTAFAADARSSGHMEKSAIPTSAVESRPFLAGVDDDPEGRRIVGSECPQRHLHDKLLSDPVERIAEGVVIRSMADARAITKNRDMPQTPPELGELLEAQGQRLIPITLDSAEHAKWRRVLDPIFTPRKVAPLADAVRARADAYIDDFIDAGEADVYDAWCDPLPSSIFLDIMGIPQSELAPFLHFKQRLLPSAKYMPTFEEMIDAGKECDAWFGDEFDRRRTADDPGDGVIGDLLRTEIEDHLIDRSEFLAVTRLLMIAGLDTVGGSLACMLAWLARHPEHRARLVADPELWPAAVEELLRWESPVQGQGGYATADVTLPSGEVIEQGTTAMIYIAAANLDPEVFEDPLEVRLDRSPNPHIAFASGFHRCLGSHLARLELRVSLEQFHRRIPEYSIPEGVELRYWGAVRAPRPLPLEWPRSDQ